MPAGGGRAILAGAGELLAVVDVEGSQVADLVAIQRDDPRMAVSPHQTRSTLRRLTLRIGDRLVNQDREPVLEIVRDDVGVHDLRFCACGPALSRFDARDGDLRGTVKPLPLRPGGHGMTRRFIVLALGFLLAPMGAPGPAVRSADAFHEANVHADGGVWFPTLEMEARSSREGLTGDLVTERDLNVEDPDYVLQGAITFRLAKRHTIRAEGFGFSVEGSGPLSRTFNFDGDTFPVSTIVSSEAEVAFFGADYGFDLVHSDVLALNLTLGARFVTGEASIRAPLLGLEGKGELSTAMPAVGLGVILHPFPIPLLSSLALSARIAGGTIGDEGSFIDAEGGVEWLPIPILALRIGYRYFWGKGERDRDEAEVTLMGPYASLTLSF